MRNFKGAAQGAAIPRERERKKKELLIWVLPKKKSSAEIDELKEKWV